MNYLSFTAKLAGVIPWRWGCFFLKGLSRIYYIFCRRKFVVLANLRLAFPDWPVDKIEDTARAHFFHSALGFWELLRLRQMGKKEVDALVKIEAEKEVWEELQAGRCVLLGIHMGSWGLANCWLAYNIPYAFIARRQRSRALAKFMDILRRRHGWEVIYENDLRSLRRCGRSRCNLGLVFDHGAGDSQFCAPFFSRLVPVPLGPLRLALRFGKKIVPAVITRRGSRHRLQFFLPLEVKSESDFASAAAGLNRCFESCIKARPEEFLWSYKRFKRSRDIWLAVVSDGRAGHRRQALSLAQMVSELAPSRRQIIEVRLKGWQKAVLDIISSMAQRPSFLLWGLLKAVLADKFDEVFRYADIFISCGSSTASLARLLSLCLGSKVFQILRPNSGRRFYDLVIIPEHDRPAAAANTLRVKGALVYAPPAEEEASARRLENYLWQSKDYAFRLGIFLGGPLRGGKALPSASAQDALAALKRLSRRHNAGLLITTSRRTPVWLEAMLKEEFSDFENTLLLLIANEKNYSFAAAGIRNLSDLLLVTSDSVSMVTEAAWGRDTFVLDLFSARAQSPKHKAFLDDLQKGGYIKPVSAYDLEEVFEAWQKKKFSLARLRNDKIIKERLEKIIS